MSRLATDDVLTPAETRVASGFAAGMAAKEIADAAGISPNTVARHTQRIYDKTGIPRSTNALAAWFLATNCGIDLAEFRRRVGAALLLGLIAVQTVCTDFNSDFVRTAGARRVAARRGGRRRGREEDGNTFDITTI